MKRSVNDTGVKQGTYRDGASSARGAEGARVALAEGQNSIASVQARTYLINNDPETSQSRTCVANIGHVVDRR